MKVPEIRIKGYDREWKHLLLQDCLLINVSKNKGNKYGKKHVLSVSDDVGVVNQIKHLGRSYAGSSVENYKILKPNQVVYTKSPLKEKPYGIIKVNKGESGIVSVLYAIYDAVEGVCPNYIERYFEPNFRINRYLLPLISKGAKNTINISDENALKGYINIPDFNEQQDIANYFQLLDDIILATTKKIEKLKQTKEASLVAMFPQKGETRPRVRFKGFESDWKEIAFSDITFHAGVKNRENLPLESYSISNEHGFIPQNEQFENGGTMSSADKRMYYIVSPNSFAYNPARINVGSLGYYSGEKDVIVSSLYEVFKTTEDINDIFLFYWFKTNIFNKMIELYQEGGVRLYFFYDKLCQCSTMIPSIEEQRMIANYFSTIDKQISLEEQKLESLKRIKSACLDKMFI